MLHPGPEVAARRRSLLHIAIDTPLSGGVAQDRPWLVLHDRYGDLAAARALGLYHLGATTLRIAVRSARTQTRGSLAPPKGNFWFIGPPDRPELSTLGDALYQLDLLLNDLYGVDGIARLNVLGQGEGATVALLLALIRPDLIATARLIDASFPVNFDRIPLMIGDANALRLELYGAGRDCAGLASSLARVVPAATVTTINLGPNNRTEP